MIKAELTRQRWSVRKQILEELKEFLQHEELEQVDPDRIPDSEYSPPDLLPFLKR